MADINNDNGFHHFPQRKDHFKKMVGEICSSGGSNSSKDSEALTLIQTKSGNWLSKNPKRWKKFQQQYQNEFDEKIKLMDQIRGRKKDNNVIHSLFSLQDSDF